MKKEKHINWTIYGDVTITGEGLKSLPMVISEDP